MSPSSRSPATGEQRRTLEARLGLRVLPAVTGSTVAAAPSDAVSDIEVLALAPGQDPVQLAQTLRTSGLYAYAEPDYLLRAAATPDDPAYLAHALWGLDNQALVTGVPDADIDAPEAWALRTSAPGIIVAIVDSGLRLTHEDLAPNLWVNPAEIPGNGLDDDANGFIDDVHGIDATLPLGDPARGDPSDTFGHGTHLAGIIGAVGNNTRGTTGVAWQVQLMPLRFLDETGTGTTSDAITCLDYARLHGARVINASWGAYAHSVALRDALQRCRDAGVLLVAAAGNDATDLDTTPYYPAAYALDRLLAVTASDQKDALAAFSGGSASNFGGATVHLAAPGRDIYGPDLIADDAYVLRSGTSMAAAYVTGSLALLAAHHPGATPDQLINRLLRGLEGRPALLGRTLTGGRLNLHDALTAPLATPPHDDFATATALTGPRVWHRSTTHAATAQPGEPAFTGAAASASVWFTWTAPATATYTLDLAGSSFDTRLAVCTGTSLGTLSVVAANNNTSASVLTSRLVFPATGGTTYRFVVDGQGGATGLLQLTLDNPPSNDDFASATVLAPTPPVQLTTSSRSATSETGEPAHAGSAPAASLWFRWTAATSGRVAISTLGSSYDTRLAVYTGSSLASLSLLLANADTHPEQRWSRVEWDATAGTTYRIAVDGQNHATGTLALTLARPAPHNTFALATPLSDFGTVTSDLRGASRETGEPAHAGDPSGTSVWWTWTAPANGAVRAHTAGSSIDTVLALYAGGPGLGDLTLLAANDDDPSAPAQLHSAVSLNVAAGETYHLAVAGFHGAEGPVSLTLEPADLNYPPVITAATVTPEGSAFDDASLELIAVEASDPEGDGFNLFLQWQYSTDGVAWTDAGGEDQPVLAPDPGRSGRFWRLRLVAADLRGDSPPFYTTSVALDNRPPATGRHGQPLTYDSDLPLATGLLGAAGAMPQFRIAAGGALPPGLTLNSSTGLISGNVSAPAGGLYEFTIERVAGPLTSGRPLSLLIGTAAGAYRVPAGRTWTLSGDTELEGAIAVDGTIERGPYGLSLTPVFGAWTALFLSGQPAAARLPTADPDLDGETNYAEWAFSGRPLGQEPLPRLPLLEALPFWDGTFLVLTFQRQRPPRALEYIFEASRDLVTWTELSIDENLIAEIVEGDPFYEVVVVRDPEPVATTRSRYLRVRAVSP